MRMTLAQFQTFVQQNIQWFEGVAQETEESLRSAEQRLGCPLPRTLRWLLSELGYSDACGISSLSEAVKRTEEVRQSIGLPDHYIILNDMGDAGLIYFDSSIVDVNGEYRLIWAGGHDIEGLAAGRLVSEEVDIYEDCPAWTRVKLEDAQDEPNAYQGAA